jgi:2-keto-4-pentenoate hydratase/2-oxohepta-3-ene-1,7-dioic acid hydratase in catechol pathway
MNGAWCVFRNYAAHADEIGGDLTDYPLFFLKPPSAIVEADSHGNNTVVLLVPSEHIDHEVEMAIRLGDDLQPVAMCVAVDTTNRTRQGLAKQKGWPWLEGKGFRGSAVMGTWTRYQAGSLGIGC